MTVSAFSQNSILRQRLELATVEVNEGAVSLEVFQMEDNGRYYLSVGHLGIGDDIIQFQVDPLGELFIPVGETLAESIETLEQLKAFYKEPSGSSMEIPGCLTVAYPGDEMETVTVTSRKLIFSRLLEFSVQRDSFIRATHISRSDFSSLLTTLKLYRKLHPNEK